MCGWHARMRIAHVQHVSIKLEDIWPLEVASGRSVLTERHDDDDDVRMIEKGNPKEINQISFNRITKNAIKTHYLKVKINNTQQNGYRSLYGDRHKMVNHVISECSKLTKREYKIRHDWLGKLDPLGIVQKIKI